MKKTDQLCHNCKHFERRGYCSKHKESTTESSWCATWKKPATKKAEASNGNP